MTKLPKGLEKLIEQKADDGKWLGGSHGQAVNRAWKHGANFAALEILARAQKLAEALKRIENVNFCDADMDSDERVRIAVDALAEWNEFVGDEK